MFYSTGPPCMADARCIKIRRSQFHRDPQKDALRINDSMDTHELCLNSSTTQGIQHIWTPISQQLHVIAKSNVASVKAMLLCGARYVVRTSLCGEAVIFAPRKCMAQDCGGSSLTNNGYIQFTRINLSHRFIPFTAVMEQCFASPVHAESRTHENSAAETVNIDRIPSYGNHHVDPLMHRQTAGQADTRSPQFPVFPLQLMNRGVRVNHCNMARSPASKRRYHFACRCLNIPVTGWIRRGEARGSNETV